MNNQMTDRDGTTAEELKEWGAGVKKAAKRAQRKETFTIFLFAIVFAGTGLLYYFIFFAALFFIPDSWRTGFDESGEDDSIRSAIAVLISFVATLFTLLKVHRAIKEENNF